jgi:exopolyphosphatase/guanosine-5'-triphosphate,3'-diphosphate pyrophosphatase
MAGKKKSTGEHVVGFMDVGTNAARLLIVRIKPNHSYAILTRQREGVRLGEGEFSDQKLHPEAMQRTILVCRKFADMARSYGAEEIVAVATSASREASNQHEFLHRLRDEAQLDLRIISGKEEARLIFLGVSRGVHLGAKEAVFIDIGGGSTEVIVGGQREYEYLESLKLGAIRLTNMFFDPDETGPVSPKRYEEIREYARNTAVRVIEQVKKCPVDAAVGSSGTILNLAEIATRLFTSKRSERQTVLKYSRLSQVVKTLCELPLDQRRKVPGIQPDRADIIIAGAAILDAFMQALDLGEIRVSDRSLRNGLLVDYLVRTGHAETLEAMSVRERSALLLGRACNFDETHARRVEQLSLNLFDSGRAIGLHTMGAWERELLGYAALLHDIGVFLSFTNHHAHSYYMIDNADLLGFDQKEIDIIANTARFHRKAFPRANRPELLALEGDVQERVVELSVLLRLAEALDRSHAGIVERVAFENFANMDKKKVGLTIYSERECPLEVWGVGNHEKAFKKAFERKLVIESRVGVVKV